MVQALLTLFVEAVWATKRKGRDSTPGRFLDEQIGRHEQRLQCRPRMR